MEHADTVKVADPEHSAHLGMAIKLAEKAGDQLMFVNGIGWHYWDGKRWAVDPGDRSRRAVHAVLKDEWIAAAELGDTDKVKRGKEIMRYETAPAITGILTEAAVLEAFSTDIEDLDADPYLLNCANGTLDLREMTRRAHDPADRITKVTRGAYDPDALGPVWDASLALSLPDPEVRAYLQRVIGVSLLGRVIEQNLVILTGTGGNGKGTFYLAVMFMLGDYASMADPQLFMERKGETSQAEMALRGRRLVVVTESGRNIALDEARMKRLTGGDVVSGRYLYKQQTEFTPSHLPLFVTNFLPKVSGDDDAVWRRLRVVPFVVTIPPEQWNKHIDEALQAEADAILTWAVNGWADYLGWGEELAAPPAVLARTEKYRADSDDLAEFLKADDWVITGSPLLKATTNALHAAYDGWAKEEGGEEMNLKRFGIALTDKGYPVLRSNGKRWRDGIGVTPRG
jgi:putative DNA primase/helicase